MSRKKEKKRKPKQISNGAKAKRSRELLLGLNGSRFTRIEAYPPTVQIRKADQVWYGGFERVLPKTIVASTIHSLKDYTLHEHDEPPAPPKNAERFLSFFLQSHEREAVTGDLTENYRQKCKQYGNRKADLWMYLQVAQSLLPLVMRLFGKISWLILGEWVKKHIS